jgi:hypothetical protein
MASDSASIAARANIRAHAVVTARAVGIKRALNGGRQAFGDTLLSNRPWNMIYIP